MTASVFYQCAGAVLEPVSGALQCSTGWVMVTEPAWELISYEDASGLFAAILGLVTTAVIFRILGKFIYNS